MRWNGWKAWLVGIFVIGALGLRAGATAPGMDLVLFPANLGAQADGQVVPLTVAPAWLNHGYGLHPIISEARGYVGGGGLPIPGGLEMNANLASLYGISVDPEDSTQVPQLPVVLRLQDGWRLPEYSPYTREQVVVATLWAVLANTSTTAERPLTIKVEAKEPEFAKYAGKYVLAADRRTLASGELRGSGLRRSAQGVLEVVFDPKVLPPRRLRDAATQPPEPAFVPLLLGGGESEEHMVVVPQWLGSQGDRLNAPWIAVPRARNFHSARVGENANPLHVSKLRASDAVPGEVRMSIWLKADDGLLQDFATACLASLLNARPTAERPLTVSLGVDKESAESWQQLAAAGWQRTETQSELIWTRAFTQMPEEILGWRLKPSEFGGFLVERADSPKPQ